MRHGKNNLTGQTDLGRLGTYTEGLPATATHCPRCRQLLVRRAERLYCLYGCTREWAIVGGSLARQAEYERAAGLRHPDPLLDHESPSTTWRRRASWKRRPTRAPRGIKVAPGVRA